MDKFADQEEAVLSRPIKLILVAGARPNFIKIASLMEALGRREDRFSPFLVHTGQHYDESMSRAFFDELRIPRPDCELGVGSETHAKQTAKIMVGFESVLLEHTPDAIVVVGDVNSTVACALVGVKLGVLVAHVEAGLRSFDRRMPEEINRILTDAISDFLFVSEPAGVTNLRREGIPEEKIHFVGNVMIDTLIRHRKKAEDSAILGKLGLKSGEYALVTLHRPSNVDHAATFREIVAALNVIGARLPVVFPVHPRTLDRLNNFGLRHDLEAVKGLRLISPLGYLDFLKLQAEARMVLTDSGGIQEETTVLKVPCITIRENTERPITVSSGTNVLAGTRASTIVELAEQVLRGEARIPDSPPDLWDGRAAERIVAILKTGVHARNPA